MVVVVIYITCISNTAEPTQIYGPILYLCVSYFTQRHGYVSHSLNIKHKKKGMPYPVPYYAGTYCF